jgi:hypothetical protein
MGTFFNKDFTFRFIGLMPNFCDLQNEVKSISEEEWTKFTYRQKNIVGHQDTLTIPLIFDHAKKSRFLTHENYYKFKEYLDALSVCLQEKNEPYLIQRANLVLLKPKSFIKRHKDVGDFLQKTRRMHIPIITNRDCYLTVEDDKKHFPEGEIWEIDNTGKIHSAHNEGQTIRVHLIIDTN